MDALAAALKHASRERGATRTYRELAAMTEALAQEDTRNLGSSKDWIAQAFEKGMGAMGIDSLRRMRTLVLALWDGDLHAFTKDTGLYLPDPTLAAPTTLNSTRQIAVFQEGQPPKPDERMPQQEYRVPEVDVLLHITTDAMQPLLYPGDEVGVQWRDVAQPEDIVVIRMHESEALRVAVYLGGDQYAYLRYPGRHELGTAKIVGVVESMKPRFRLS